jgi:hypothetical protein
MVASIHMDGIGVYQDLLNLRPRAKWAYHQPKNKLEIGNRWRDTPLRILWAGTLTNDPEKV